MGTGKASRSQRGSRNSVDSATLKTLEKNIRKSLEEEQERKINSLAQNIEQLLNINKVQAQRIRDIELC